MMLLATLALSNLASAVQGPPGELPEASALLEQSRAALGDPARLAAAKSLSARGRAQLDEVEGFITEVYGGLRRARSTTDLPFLGRYEFGCDGEVVWERNPLGVTIHRGWEACHQLRMFGIAQHVDWREMYVRARSVGRAELDGRACWELELTPRMLVRALPEEEKELPWPDRWFLDAETLLLRRIVSRSVGLLGEPELVQLDLDDWRAVDGVRYPYRVEMTVGELEMSFRYDSYEHDVELAVGFFDLEEDLRRAAAEHAADPAGEIALEQLETRHLASIRVTCERAALQRTLAVVLPETLRYVTSIGAVTTGPPLVRYHAWGETLDLEGGIPVAAPVAGKGRVHPGLLPAGQAAVAWHVGPYERLGETHERLGAYLASHGLEPDGAPWEEYWTDPGLEPDPAKWRTKVVQPVRAAKAPEQRK